MTDNDAAKALDDIVTAYCMLLGMDPPIPDPLSQTAEQVKLIRTKLAKSAKVDGLLEAIAATDQYLSIMISRMENEGKQADKIWLAKALRDQNKKAIQRFNGEV